MTIYVTEWADGARHYVNTIMRTHSTLLLFILKQTYFTYSKYVINISYYTKRIRLCLT